MLRAWDISEKWKDANLVPIQKCESKTMVSNYRGISLLDVLSKNLERQVYNEIWVLFALFLPTGSMVSCQENPLSQLSRVVHQFAAALERRQQVDVIYLDFF